MIDAVFPITLSLQVPNFGQPENSCIINIQLNLFLHLIVDQYSKSGNIPFFIPINLLRLTY